MNNQNYIHSIKKWKNIKEAIKSMPPDITEDELRNFWNIRVWYRCGFCYEFGFGGEVKTGNLNCNKCPLNKKHCNQHTINCTYYRNTMHKIHKAIREKKLTRAINLIDYFIRCMGRHKNKFNNKEE